MKVRIEVTSQDIFEGKQRSKDFCPIAIASRRAGYPLTIGAYEVCCRSIDGQCLGHTWLPKEAEEFVRRFDENRSSVSPFSFDVNFIGAA